MNDFRMKPANILKITSLDKDWHDKDTVLLHAAFQLLQDCVEQEDLLHMWGTKGDPKSAQAKRELRQLYRWWLKRRNRKDRDYLSSAGVRRYHRDTAKLARLVALRGYLWT